MVLGSEILWQNSNDTGFRTISRNVENLSADKFAKFPCPRKLFLIRILIEIAFGYFIPAV